jgi:hypothetical protein
MPYRVIGISLNKFQLNFNAVLEEDNGGMTCSDEVSDKIFNTRKRFGADNKYLIRGCSSGVPAPVGKGWFLDLSGPGAKATSLTFLQTVIDDVTKQPYLSCLTSI